MESSKIKLEQGEHENSASSCDPLPTVPPEILMKILREVPSSYLLTCRLVSKEWNQIATSLYRDRPDSVKLYFNLVSSLNKSEIIKSNERFFRFLDFFKSQRSSISSQSKSKGEEKESELAEGISVPASLPSPFSRLAIYFSRIDVKKSYLSKMCGNLSALGETIKYIELVPMDSSYMMDNPDREIFVHSSSHGPNQRPPLTRRILDDFFLELLYHLPHVQEISLTQPMETSMIANFLRCSKYESSALGEFRAGWSWPISIFVQSTEEERPRPTLIMHHLQKFTLDDLLTQANYIKNWTNAERKCHCWYCNRLAKNCGGDTGECDLCSGCSCCGEDELGGNLLDFLGKLANPRIAPPITRINLSLNPEKIPELPHNFWDFFPRLKNLQLEILYTAEVEHEENNFEIDSFLTGFSQEDCQRLDRDVDSISGELERKNSSILQLHELASLQIVLRGKRPDRRYDNYSDEMVLRRLGISKVSGLYAFRLMRNTRVTIKVVDFFPRGTADDHSDGDEPGKKLPGNMQHSHDILSRTLQPLGTFVDSVVLHKSVPDICYRSVEWTLLDKLLYCM